MSGMQFPSYHPERGWSMGRGVDIMCEQIDMKYVRNFQKVAEDTGVTPAQLLQDTRIIDGMISYLTKYFLDQLLDTIKEEFDIIDLVSDEDLEDWAWSNDFIKREER
jgi:hypothetical protein